jgi:methionine sulfoxide reductase heme-binding subunit
MKAIYRIKGWNIVGWSTIAIAVIFALILIVHGINEQSMRMAIRLTARTSCVLFLLAFCASSLRRFKSNQLTQWLLRNRRYLGVSMAVSHGFHAIAIISVAMLSTGEITADNHGGNLGYLFIIAMTITSFRRPASLLGDRNWQILHTVGMYYLWLAFTVTFSEKLNESMFIYPLFVSLLIIAIALRLIVPIVSRKSRVDLHS